MNPACDHAQMTARNQELVREFFATLSTGAGLTKGGDAVIDDFLTPVRGMFAPGDPKIHVKRTFSDGDIFGAETEGIGELANGNHYHNRYAWVIEMKDDKVCHLREYMDAACIMSEV